MIKVQNWEAHTKY